MMARGIDSIIASLPVFMEAADGLQESVLSNLIMLGEIPAPTFHEENRISFFIQRLNEYGVSSSYMDEAGNGIGIIDGEEPEQNIVIVARADTVFPDTTNHSITVKRESIVGPGVSDNSLGLAAICVLPVILNQLGIHLKSSLILVGSARGRGRGDLRGLRFLLENNRRHIRAGISVEGAPLGRLSFESLGMFRGEITCTVPQAYDWTRFGASGAIITLNEIITRIAEIPLPRRPFTNIVLGSMQGGSTFNRIAQNAWLRFEVRSECPNMVTKLREDIENIVTDVASQTGEEIILDIFATRKPGGIHFGHPLPRTVQKIITELQVQPRINASTAELSAFADSNIPAVTIGLSSSENMHNLDETVLIKPVSIGIAQLMAIIKAIDEGHCDEHGPMD